VLREKKKIYYQQNKERIKVKTKRNFIANSEQIRAYRAQKIECKCGKIYTQGNKARHLKSMFHNNYK
jgi:hypothetical protein